MMSKRKPENIAFSVAITPGKKKKIENDDQRCVAVLAPFNPFPKVSFENIKLHTAAVQEVYLVNPTENVIQVELTKLPDEGRGYQWSATEFKLPKESQAKLIITWTPLEYGSWHENVKIVNKKTKKTLSELKLSSTTEEPPKVSKRSLRSTGNLAKKHSNASKQVIGRKKSTIQTISENKENESTLINKSKKLPQTSVSIQNQNVIICESKKSCNNKTFTQVREDDLGDQHCDKTPERYISQLVSTIAFTQSSRKVQLEPLTLQHGTYNVIEPGTSSRRSTYLPRSRQINSIIDIEKEKNEFELLASPGVHNESLELAASRLLSRDESQNVKVGLNSVDKADLLVPAGSCTTFTIQPSVTYDIVEVLPSVTYSVLEVPCSPSSITRQSTVCNQLLNERPSERVSFDSIASSENFYDSLEERKSRNSLENRLGSEIDKNEDLLANWDDIYDLDKFSLQSENLHRKKSSFSNGEQKQRECLNSLLDPEGKSNEHFQERFSKDIQASSSNLLLESPFRNITQRRKPSNISFSRSLNSEKDLDSLENVIPDSMKNLNQTKDNLLQIDEDFGKFNFSIVSSSRRNSEVTPRNLQNTLSNNLNKTFTPIKNSTDKSDKLENSFEENGSYDVSVNVKLQKVNRGNTNENKYSKDLKISNSDLALAKTNKVENKMFMTDEKYINGEVRVLSNGTQNNLLEQRMTHHMVQSEDSLSKTNECLGKQIPEMSTDSKHHLLIWNISPPKSTKGKEDIGNKITQYNLPKIKDPVSFKRQKPSLSYLPSKTNISVFENQHDLQGRANCQKTTEPSSSKVKNKADIKDQSDTRVSSEEIFLVPSVRVKGSLAKTGNCSPPKIRRISQELKIKRLSTPSTSRKLPLSSMTEERKKHKPEVPRSLPRSTSSIKKRKSLKVADWVPAVRKLKLSCTSSQSEEDNSASAEDLATPDPFLAATTLNPFAKGGLFFNRKWLKDQEIELIQWTDRMLRPPNELELDRDQSERSVLHRLNALRATAFSILISTEVKTVLSRVKVAVDRNIISIRSDRQLHADLGLQDKIICLLMSYNPLWLRLCLEAVYQCNIQLKCHSDEAGLREFIRRYVLNDEDLRQTYSHPTIPYLMLPEFEDEMKKFTVYKFLVIVYLLDLVKTKKVILHNPCLFKKVSELKSSKDILIDFNKNFVAGAGDITKILRLRGYEVSHHQTYIDEFDFSLTSSIELRDGIRLTRLAENLVGDNTLCSKLRVPAVSNLQKKFNAEVAFKALKQAGYDLPLDVSPKDISDGHNEKTLSFLWHLKQIIQKRAVLLIIMKWRETKQVREDRKNFLKIKKSVIRIQRWYRKNKRSGALSEEEVKKAYEAREHFLKLKSVVIKLQRRVRSKKKQREYIKKSQAAAMIQKWYRNRKIVLKDINHFKASRQAVFTIQRAFRNYRSKRDCSALADRVHFLKVRAVTIMLQRRFRFIQLAKHERQKFLSIKTAAIKIQRRLRATKQAKNGRKDFLAIKSAAVIIQKRFRSFLLTKHQRQEFLKKKIAVTVIQKRFRECKQAKNQRKEFLVIKTATVTIQRNYRAFLVAKCQRKHREEFLAMKIAAVKLQRRFRDFQLTKKLRQEFLEIKSAVLTIQRRFRANKQAAIVRKYFLAIKTATVTIQRWYRNILQGKQQRQDFLEMKTTASTVQKKFRANRQAKIVRKKYLAIKYATVAIQRRFRNFLLAKQQRQDFLELKIAVVIIQRRFRANKLSKVQRVEFLAIRSASVSIQRHFRTFLLAKQQRQDFLELKNAVVTTQRRFRSNKQARVLREEFLATKSATVAIQRRFRIFLLAKQQRQDFLELKYAVVTTQRRFRANKQARVLREEFLATKSATVSIQRQFRTFLLAKQQRKDFLELKNAVVTTQRRFRAKKQAKVLREEFIATKDATVAIQRRFRTFLLAKQQRQDFLELKNAVVTTQRRFRSNKQSRVLREEFLATKSATVAIQRQFRTFLLAKQQKEDFLELKNAVVTTQRRFRAKKQARVLREEFIATKDATVAIQRRFRTFLLAKQQRQDFLELKNAVVTTQRRFRSNKQVRVLREEFLATKFATVTIQRRFRTFLLAKQQREDFLELKNAVVTTQRRFRANKQARVMREEFLATKSATVAIQKRFRTFLLAKQLRQDFLELKNAVVTTQRRFRANKQARVLREEFIATKFATVAIQRRLRTFLLAKQQRQDFLELKNAVVTTQRRFRANKQARVLREEFVVTKSATVAIQRCFRTFILAKQQRQDFLELKYAVVTTQRKFRANKQSKVMREEFLSIKTATVTIQRRFRGFLISKQQRKSFLDLKSSAIIIQRRFRANKEAKMLREEFIAIKTAALKIQRKFKSNNQAKILRKKYLVIKNAAILIQIRFRAFLLAKHQRKEFLAMKAAAITIQRRFRIKRMARLIEHSVISKMNAAIKIQAAYRGYLVRKKVTLPRPPKIKPTSSEMAADNHQPISTRGQRYFKVLSNYQRCPVAELQNILFKIDKITVMSADQCEYFVRNGAVKILYAILNQSNRSLGVHKCVELTLSILLNLYRAPITADLVWKETRETDGIFTVFDLMMRFKTEKTSTVFPKACTVIWLFAQDPVKAQVITKTPKIEDIYKFVVKSMKKSDESGPTGCKISNKKPVVGTRKKLPALHFNWGNYFNDHVRAFEDKSFALSCVIDKLNPFLKV